jgi:hypothetical protein
MPFCIATPAPLLSYVVTKMLGDETAAEGLRKPEISQTHGKV